MKHKILSLIALAGMTLGFTACSDDAPYILGDDNKGTGQLSLSDLGVEVSTDEVTLSRAVDPTIDTSGYLVSIDDSEGRTVYSTTMANRNELITLPVGTGYTIHVASHEVQNVEWARPHYTGSKTFDISENQITMIGTVECHFSSIRVSIRYSDQLKALLNEDCNVRVECSETQSYLDYTSTETRSGYFKALEGSTTLGATFTGTIKGQAVSYNKALNDVAAGQHRIITFSVRTGDTDVPDEFGNLVIAGDGEGVKLADGLYLVATVTTVDIDGNVSSGEEGDSSAVRPGQQEPEPGPEPDPGTDPSAEVVTFTTSQIKFGVAQSPTSISDGLIVINADKGIKNLVVTISTDNPGFQAAVEDLLPLSFDLANIDPTDTELLGHLTEDLHFPVNGEVKGQTTVNFDITAFIPLLSAFGGTHTFTIEVTDMEGNRVSKQVIFTV